MNLVRADGMGKTVKRIILFLAVLWLAISGYTFMTGGGLGYALSELVVVLTLIFLITVWLPGRKTNRAWQDMEMSGKSDEERTLSFFEDRVEIECAGEMTIIEYSEISRKLQKDNLVVLLSDDKKGIIIKNDSFIQGSFDVLMELIKKSGGLQS